MTICAVWVRALSSGGEELVLCSDSRLVGGKRFDQGQKIFRFSRTDAAICFAGGTDWAYPMIVAAVTAAELHAPSQTRALKLPAFKSHLVHILNQLQLQVHHYAKGQDIPDVTFIFGGYDWFAKSFRMWRIAFSEFDAKFVAHERRGSNGFGALGMLEVAGDEKSTIDFKNRLKQIAQSKYGLDMRAPPNARFDMEPFEAVCQLLSGATSRDNIGGSPQAVKIYQFMNSTDVGVFWPNSESGRLFVSGRPLLEYERATVKSVLDPGTLNSTWCSGNTEHARNQIQKANATVARAMRSTASLPR